LHQTWLAYTLRQGGDFIKVKTPQNVLSSSPCKGSSCSSGTKHDRITAQTKVVCVEEEIAENRPELRKPVLCSSTGEGGSCSSETKYNRKKVPRPVLFISPSRQQEQRPNPRKNCPGFEYP
jgi:hypothetical protein